MGKPNDNSFNIAPWSIAIRVQVDVQNIKVILSLPMIDE